MKFANATNTNRKYGGAKWRDLRCAYPGPQRWAGYNAAGGRENAYSIFTSGVYKATALDAAFPQEKPHFPEPDCAE
jgi:hypothetical protein